MQQLQNTDLQLSKHALAHLVHPVQSTVPAFKWRARALGLDEPAGRGRGHVATRICRLSYVVGSALFIALAMRHPRVRSKRHEYQTVVLLALSLVVAAWTLWQVALNAVTEKTSQSIVPADSHVLAEAKREVPSRSKQPTRLLLASHNRLFWYFPETEEEIDVHSGQV